MVERAGIQLAQERLAGADLVVLVSDRSEPWSAADQALLNQWPKAVLVHNKCDLPAATGNRTAQGTVPFSSTIAALWCRENWDSPQADRAFDQRIAG